MNDVFGFLDGESATVAARLLGCQLVRELDGHELVSKIVETEAYDQADAASHSYQGRTPRSEVMFGPSGCAYVYFTYGLHYCLNVVTGPVGHGSAVLIRALEPLSGINAIRAHRPKIHNDVELMNGPAKLCQALLVDKKLNGHDLHKSPLRLVIRPPLMPPQIVQTTRIGITHDADRLWRFYIKESEYISRPAV